MPLSLKVIADNGKEFCEPYLLSVFGWAEERYFKEAPETKLAEFEDGELIMPSPVGFRHQDVVRFLTVLLSIFVESRRLGQIFNGAAVTRLRPGLNYEPDVFFIPAGRRADITEQYFEGAPALVIEVLSESTRRRDLTTKAANYREYGVPQYWAVDHRRRILYHHSLPQGAAAPYLVTQWTEGKLDSEPIPGFWIDVSWLWRDPLAQSLDCLRQILGSL